MLGTRSSGRPKLSSSSTPLPSFSDSIHEKHRLTHSNSGLRAWFVPFDVATPPVPGFVRRQRVRLYLPLPIVQLRRRAGKTKQGTASLVLTVFIALLMIFALHKRFATRSKSWPQFVAGAPPSLVYGRSDLRRIWLWEIASGHYPSSRPCMFVSGRFVRIPSLNSLE
jgi:WD repeat and SOF domain-containing protein 1